MKKLSLVLYIFIFAFSTMNILAAPVGTLTLEMGIVKLRRNFVDTIYHKAGLEIPVSNEDEIQTGRDTKVKIQFNTDGNDVRLLSHTFFIISNIGTDEDKVYMPVGKARFLIKKSKTSGKIRKRFRLRTTNAIIGVKGTEFVVGVGDGATSLFTISGIVTLANLAMPTVIVNVKANQASKIQQADVPTKPIVVPPQVREKIISADSIEVFDQVEFGEIIKDTKQGQKSEVIPVEEIPEEEDPSVSVDIPDVDLPDSPGDSTDTDTKSIILTITNP